ncbi:ParA family protein [Solwaraspora sp. WMMD1047]|uniref:ParA family protein n=1 Tax=Solwaraspora sp. WMMD1047 TaxID=3016102 RepID=UPI0024170F2B|nr:ParA family protein [Solwaraspora sp. WMMD1047]MDG4833011.1 ParA family protein [Solwaraspora sp. WMMD1047]
MTTAALAMLLTWSRPLLLAECDPAGGDIRAGFLRNLELPADQGLMRLVVAERRGQADEHLWEQLIDLDPPDQRRLLLPGIATPTQAASLDPSWHQLGIFFSSLARGVPGYDVLVDCGRLIAPHAPWPLLNRADLVLLVVRPTLASLVPARAALDALRSAVGGADPGDRLGLLVVGDGDYDAGTVAARLGTPIAPTLPTDVPSARALARGGTVRTGRPLLRAAAAAEGPLIEAVRQRQARLRRPSPYPRPEVTGAVV